MEQIKRQLSTSLNNDEGDNKRQKTQITTWGTNCLSKELVICFEDLSNDVIYEIFEFLDYFHVYQAFFNLNIRFRNLLTNSSLPIKINISSMSKSAFKHYNENIIETNMHRIKSLYHSSVFRCDRVLPVICKLSQFTQIETLILHQIEADNLEHVLNQLSSLSLLSSLVISSLDPVRSENTIYHQIFQLPALKYCKLSLEEWTISKPLPVCTNGYSSIEHLVITNTLYLNQLDGLLSYIPRLRRLSFHALSETCNEQSKIQPRLLHHLTHVSLKVQSVKFNEFEQLFTNIFHTVQVLHLTIRYDRDREYIAANKWKQLILSHIPNLRILDIRYAVWCEVYGRKAATGDAISELKAEIKQFESPYWIERQWFFAHQFYKSARGKCLVFCSTNPYRRKDYTLYKQLDKNTALHHPELNLRSVENIYIETEKSIINCTQYFPNAIELTLRKDFSSTCDSVSTILNHIIPLQQLTKLVIECDYFSFKNMIELLCCTPNIRSLKFKSMPSYQKANDYTSVEQMETFRLVSNTNNIINVTFTGKYTLEKLKLLFTLCPRLQHLTIDTYVANLESTIRFVLDKTNGNTRHLCSLCFLTADDSSLEELDTFIKSETQLDDYTLKLISSKLYLSW